MLDITFFFNLSYLTQGDLEKIRPKRPTKFGRNRAETTQAETTRAETTQGRNDSGPKQLRAETTRDHSPGPGPGRLVVCQIGNMHLEKGIVVKLS